MSRILFISHSKREENQGTTSLLQTERCEIRFCIMLVDLKDISGSTLRITISLCSTPITTFIKALYLLKRML